MEREVSENFWTIKKYLLNRPVLIPLETGKALLPYLSFIEDAVGSVLA